MIDHYKSWRRADVKKKKKSKKKRACNQQKASLHKRQPGADKPTQETARRRQVYIKARTICLEQD